ncbi:MAG TPA: YHS domain-containing (seleno)protein [Chthoniobacterales bacterium]|jgi:YHS domain-containing protein|nr:YHS domain-containing (seleno)protein [Chthoniobacterales bacterium]
MNILNNSLAAAAVAAMVAGVFPNPAYASEKAILNPLQIERSGGSIIVAQTEGKTKKVRLHNVILHGYDPVAYFKQDKAVRGNPAIRSEYKGSTYLFASQDDKADFDKDPARYEPQYGGFCANSMAHGERHDINPTAFRVYKGKLYVCSSQRALSEFSANIDTNISKADENWLKIGPQTYNSETMDFERPWPFGAEGGAQ